MRTSCRSCSLMFMLCRSTVSHNSSRVMTITKVYIKQLMQDTCCYMFGDIDNYFLIYRRLITISNPNHRFTVLFAVALLASVSACIQDGIKTPADDLSHVKASPIYSAQQLAENQNNSSRKHCCLHIVRLNTKASYRPTEQHGAEQNEMHGCCTEENETVQDTNTKEFLSLKTKNPEACQLVMQTWCFKKRDDIKLFA